MNKKLIWFINAFLALAIVVMLSLHFRKPSVMLYVRRLHVVAEAIQEFKRSHGEMPQSLSDLNDPRLISFRGNAIAYTNAISNFTLSIPLPFDQKGDPVIGPVISAKIPDGSRHIEATLSASYSVEITEYTEPSVARDALHRARER